jgi:hypothetical protein
LLFRFGKRRRLDCPTQLDLALARNAVGDRDRVDEPEVDDIVPELGVDDASERVLDQFGQIFVFMPAPAR